VPENSPTSSGNGAQVPRPLVTEIDEARLFDFQSGAKTLLSHLDELKQLLDRNRPSSAAQLSALDHDLEVDYVYNSIAIEGNRLSRNETRSVIDNEPLDGSKAPKEYLEAKNLAEAFRFALDLARQQRPLLETDILDLHKLVVKNIAGETPGDYRREDVTIQGSDLRPPTPFVIQSDVQKLLEWLSARRDLHPVLVAAAAHWWLARIHPFHDGNGRVARLFTNVILTRAGYPLVVIEEGDRKQYYAALAEADHGDISDFCEFVTSSAIKTARSREAALNDQKRRETLLNAAIGAVAQKSSQKLVANYHIWVAQMEKVKSEFRKVCEYLDSKLAPGHRVTFDDFGMIDIEKFRMLLSRTGAERTWFFRVRVSDLFGASRSFVFWFSWGNPIVERFARHQTLVTLHISERRGAEWITLEEPGTPELREIIAFQGEIFQRTYPEARPEAREHPITGAEPGSIASNFLSEVVQGL